MWMARAAQSERWDHTSALQCVLSEPYRDEKRHPQPFAMDEFHPFREEKDEPENVVSPWWSRLQQASLLPEGRREAAIHSILSGMRRDVSRA